MKKYGVYNKNVDEMFLMNQSQVWDYLQQTALFQNYGVNTDGETVIVNEVSAGPNGKLVEMDLEEFFQSFEEDEDILIRPIEDMTNDH